MGTIEVFWWAPIPKSHEDLIILLGGALTDQISETKETPPPPDNPPGLDVNIEFVRTDFVHLSGLMVLIVPGVFVFLGCLFARLNPG